MMNMLLEAGRARLFDLIATRPRPIPDDKRKTAVYYNNPSTHTQKKSCTTSLFSFNPRRTQTGPELRDVQPPAIRQHYEKKTPAFEEKLAFYITPLAP